MLRTFLFFFGCLFLAVSLACRSTSTNNNNSSANIPPEFSGSPVLVNGNSIPGITDANSANANKPLTGTTPGIPDTSKGKVNVPKGTTPTPGIPDQETLKKQMNTPLKDTNVVNNPQRDKKPEENSNNSKPSRKP